MRHLTLETGLAPLEGLHPELSGVCWARDSVNRSQAGGEDHFCIDGSKGGGISFGTALRFAGQVISDKDWIIKDFLKTQGLLGFEINVLLQKN